MKTVQLISVVVVVNLWQCHEVIAAKTFLSQPATAKVESVKPGIVNEWMEAVQSSGSPTNMAIKFKENLHKHFVKKNFFVVIYSRENRTEIKRDEIFRGTLCDLVDANQNVYPKLNFMPRDLIKMGFYSQKDCNFRKGQYPIMASRLVDVVPKANPGVKMPRFKPYTLVINVLSRQYLDSPDDNVLFQLGITVTEP